METLNTLSAMDSVAVERAKDAFSTLMSGFTCAGLSSEQAAFVARATARLSALIGTPISCVEEGVAALANAGEAVSVSSAYEMLVASPDILDDKEQRETLGEAVTALEQPIGGVAASGSAEIDLYATCQAAFVRSALISGRIPSVACD